MYLSVGGWHSWSQSDSLHVPKLSLKKHARKDATARRTREMYPGLVRGVWLRSLWCSGHVCNRFFAFFFSFRLMILHTD